MDTGGGAMVLGGISPLSEKVYAYSDPARDPSYNIKLMGLYVAEKLVAFESEGLYEAASVAFKDAIMKELHDMKQIEGPDPDPGYNDICFSGAKRDDGSKQLQTFPTVAMVFEKGQRLCVFFHTTASLLQIGTTRCF